MAGGSAPGIMLGIARDRGGDSLISAGEAGYPAIISGISFPTRASTPEGAL
jgi:hypothetical protein